MKKVPILIWQIIILAIIYSGLRFGIRPPIPSSLLNMYMILSIIASLIYITVQEERRQRFFQPVRDIFIKEERKTIRAIVLIFFPLLVGFHVYSKVLPRIEPPAELRSIHPAPPGEIDFQGKIIKLQGLKNPLRADKKNFENYVKEGAAIYFKNCFYCHGDKLNGKGYLSPGLNPQPADFTDVGTIAQLQESFVFWRISKGGIGLPVESAPWSSAMPAWEFTLTEEEIWKVILYLYEAAGVSPRTWE